MSSDLIPKQQLCYDAIKNLHNSRKNCLNFIFHNMSEAIMRAVTRYCDFDPKVVAFDRKSLKNRFAFLIFTLYNVLSGKPPYRLNRYWRGNHWEYGRPYRSVHKLFT